MTISDSICRMSTVCSKGTSEEPGVIHSRCRTGDYHGVSCDHQGWHRCNRSGSRCSWLADAGYEMDGQMLCITGENK